MTDDFYKLGNSWAEDQRALDRMQRQPKPAPREPDSDYWLRVKRDETSIYNEWIRCFFQAHGTFENFKAKYGRIWPAMLRDAFETYRAARR